MTGTVLHTVGTRQRAQFGLVNNVLMYFLVETSCSSVVQLHHFLIV